MVASWTACEWVVRLSPYHIIASSVGCLSVSMPYHRLVCGSAEQQNEEQRRLRWSVGARAGGREARRPQGGGGGGGGGEGGEGGDGR
jgi:hypothetical protein